MQVVSLFCLFKKWQRHDFYFYYKLFSLLWNLINSEFLGGKAYGTLKAWQLNSYCCFFFKWNRAFVVSFHNEDANNKRSCFIHIVIGAVCVFFVISWVFFVLQCVFTFSEIVRIMWLITLQYLRIKVYNRCKYQICFRIWYLVLSDKITLKYLIGHQPEFSVMALLLSCFIVLSNRGNNTYLFLVWCVSQAVCFTDF